MKFIRRNKSIIFTLVIFFVLILLCVQVKNILFPNDGLAVYGNRLEGKVELNKNLDKDIKKILTTGVTKVKSRVSGRIINITITLEEKVTKSNAKSYAKKALGALSEEEAKYYDVQFFMIKETEAKDFPIIGYKIPTSENITWTKDR